MRKEENDLIHRGTYDGTIYHNPANKFCIISVKTADKDVPQEARSTRRHKDHLIRFVATGYELPRTDAVELELDGEWKKGKYGMQLQVEQWHEIVPQTKSGVEGYLASGLIKGIGPALAKQIVSRFGVETLDILQNRPERLLEIKGITENKLEAIKTSYAESRMLQDLMTLLSPFKITPKTAQKIYQFFGPASVDIIWHTLFPSWTATRSKRWRPYSTRATILPAWRTSSTLFTIWTASFRRSIKVVNQACDVLFENEEGEIDNIFEDQMPFDTDADVIEIDDADYGIWYVDMGDNPERYEGKTVHFRGMVLKSKDVGADFFVPGRMAMTCCADDTSFIGYVCKCASAKSLVMGSWVDVTATVKWGYMKVYDGEGPVLYAKEIKPAKKPESELVYFN